MSKEINFHSPHHLSEIMENSGSFPIVIFKYSSNCGSSQRLEQTLKDKLNSKILIHKITVQSQPILSKKIEEMFGIKHETPQIIVLRKNTVIYTANHEEISIESINACI